MRILDAVAPKRLGSGFRWLLASSWLSNTGDGIAIAAGPLLVASLTGNAFLIASAALLQWLPPLVFGLGAGRCQTGSTASSSWSPPICCALPCWSC